MIKDIFIAIISLLIFVSCNSCPECFNISGPVRIIYLDNNGNNLLEQGSLEVVSVHFCNGQDIPFAVKNYVVQGSQEKYHIELANEELHEQCQNTTCCLNLNFVIGKVDTLYYRIRELNDDCCTTFNVSEFTYNNINYLGKEENTIGAYEIIVE